MQSLDNSSLPLFLQKQFEIGELANIHIDDIFVAVKSSSLKTITYTSIYSTPHYFFIKNYLKNESRLTIDNSYQKYTVDNSDACSSEDFIHLADSINNNGYSHEFKPIYVFKHWTRALPFGRFDVADGFHRLAIIAVLGHTTVTVCKLKYKYNIFFRFFFRLFRMKK